MDSFEGADGLAVIPVPAGRYASGKTCTAVDSDLVPGNIKQGVTIFGVSGSLTAGGSGVPAIVLTTTFVADALVYATPPALDVSDAMPSILDPSCST